MVTQQKPQLQATDPKTWDKATANSEIGDYIREPFQPIMVVVDKDLLPNGKIWLLVKPASGSCTEEWIVEQELATEPQQQQPQQEKTEPVQTAGMAGDSVGCQLQPNWSAVAEHESGFTHGRLDAANESHLICEEASCPYSQGYLDGYDSFHQPKPQPETKQLTQWQVTWNPKWQWYEVWVGDRWVGRASDNQEAEGIAQRYIASEQLRQQHRELVLSTIAG